MNGYVIIGGAGGIGSATCALLAEQGNQVVAGVRDLATVPESRRLKGIQYRQVDAEDWDSVDHFFADLDNEDFPLVGVALCVGSILLKPAHLTRKEEFDAVIGKNLSTAFATVRSASKRLSKNGGSIVLISTAAARHGYANHEAIAAAKGGVLGLTLSAAATYAPRGIRVNCVAPGLVNTPLAERITSNSSALNTSERLHALGRIGEPNEVARAIQWLLSPEQSWVTGQTIGVDGGLSTVRSMG